MCVCVCVYVCVLCWQLAADRSATTCQRRRKNDRYYRLADGVLDSKGSLSRTIPPAVLSEVNKRVKFITVECQVDTKIKTTKINSEGLLHEI